MTAHTPRILLRAPTPSDAAALAEATARSSDLHRHWAFSPTTAAGWRTQISRQSERMIMRLACRVTDDAIVGLVNLNEIVRGAFCSAYLGYEAFSPFDGQGYMTEALHQMLDLAFGDLALHRLEANIQPDNVRSRALVQRLGFRREGYSPRYLFMGGAWRDHERWAITAEEWRDAGVQNSRSSPESSPRSSS